VSRTHYLYGRTSTTTPETPVTSNTSRRLGPSYRPNSFEEDNTNYSKHDHAEHCSEHDSDISTCAKRARFAVSRIDGDDVASKWTEAPVVSSETGVAAVIVARNKRERRVVSFMLVFEFVFPFWGLNCKWYA
jgi:hypothetical protein